MFALYYCVTSLSYLLSGRSFVVKTDHKNLIYWNTLSASAKVERWKVALSEYDYSIIHIPGKDNVIADAMSRLNFLNNMSNASASDTPSEREGNGDDIVICNVSLVRTPSQHDDIISNFHNATVGHWGAQSTIHILKRHGHVWKNMLKDVRSFVKSCPICQKLNENGSDSHGEKFLVGVNNPHSKIAVDTAGPYKEDSLGYKYILCMIDCSSRFVELFPMKTTTA